MRVYLLLNDIDQSRSDDDLPDIGAYEAGTVPQLEPLDEDDPTDSPNTDGGGGCFTTSIQLAVG